MKRFSFSQAGGRNGIGWWGEGAKSADSATNVEAAAKTNLKQHYNFTLFADFVGDELHKRKAAEANRERERESESLREREKQRESELKKWQKCCQLSSPLAYPPICYWANTVVFQLQFNRLKNKKKAKSQAKQSDSQMNL